MAYPSKRKAVNQLTGPSASKRQVIESVFIQCNINKRKAIEPSTTPAPKRFECGNVEAIDDFHKVRSSMLGKYTTNDIPLDLQNYDTIQTRHDKGHKLTFFDLAPEIRNQIYSLSLRNVEGVAVTSKDPNKVEPALLFASKKIRQEARCMFYYNNSFQSDDIDVAIGFLRALHRPQRKVIQSFKIGDPFKAAETPIEAQLEDARLDKYWADYNQKPGSAKRRAAKDKLHTTLNKSPRAFKKHGPPPTPILPPGMEYLLKHPSNNPNPRQQKANPDKPRMLQATKRALQRANLALGPKALNDIVIKVEMLVHLPIDESRPIVAIGRAREEWREIVMREIDDYKSLEVTRKVYVMPVTAIEKRGRAFKV
ncbi:hypothetical protein CERZMDRAFT_81045 [Cercospora zeae-maydis SCOH1-5]|uniref:Uncharacterized protein n=1 Tax=Cercospora zeae-maydis SCOH1-5 TaxID=717836 RepID=A0A6A6FU99_9PEZI|nr:hypothetical protein CERZMDRAFT_81045 [Cercospora zeae-maydis SCOH1-5]